MSSWHSYPKIFAVGHRVARDLFRHEVIIEEKIDGSQISFGIFNGELKVRSKGKEQYPQTDKMFELAIEQIKTLNLREDLTYSGEYLNKPKHNTLVYDRTPVKNIVLFDIRTDEETYLSYKEKQAEASFIGLEVVPLLFSGTVSGPEELKYLLQNKSVLGGCLIEGFVVKPLERDVFGKDGKLVMAKYVSEAFKERHGLRWRADNPSNKDIVEKIIESYKTEARWQKAVQHLKEIGQLDGSPKDIGPLIKEAQRDLVEEEEEEIKQKLFNHYQKEIIRKATYGLPEWYKEKLLKEAFDE